MVNKNRKRLFEQQMLNNISVMQKVQQFEKLKLLDDVKEDDDKNEVSVLMDGMAHAMIYKAGNNDTSIDATCLELQMIKDLFVLSQKCQNYLLNPISLLDDFEKFCSEQKPDKEGKTEDKKDLWIKFYENLDKK